MTEHSYVSALEIADVQGAQDDRELAIDRVGVKGIRHPIRVRDRSGNDQHTVATFNMYVALEKIYKGTHMSRFLEVLNAYDQEMSVLTVNPLLRHMNTILGADSGHIDIQFPYFILKKAPISGAKSLIDYDVTLSGEFHGNQTTPRIKVVVPVTSLCPCSKEISDYGAHNQRSHITISVRARRFIWIEELIEIAEREASSEIYGVLKRADEKYVTEAAYDNPKFVEDMVRDVATNLNRDERIEEYEVESENFESIHNHSAYASIHYDKGASTG